MISISVAIFIRPVCYLCYNLQPSLTRPGLCVRCFHTTWKKTGLVMSNVMKRFDKLTSLVLVKLINADSDSPVHCQFGMLVIMVPLARLAPYCL